MRSKTYSTQNPRHDLNHETPPHMGALRKYNILPSDVNKGTKRMRQEDHCKSEVSVRFMVSSRTA